MWTILAFWSSYRLLGRPMLQAEETKAEVQHSEMAVGARIMFLCSTVDSSIFFMILIVCAS